MLSRLSNSGLTRTSTFNAILKRLASTEVANLDECTMAVGTQTPRNETIVDWETFKMPNAPYDGMGPVPPRPMWDAKQVRHYVIPETWFQFLKPRTGLSGFYMLGFGVSTFMLSKEIYIPCSEAVVLPLQLAFVWWLVNKYGGKSIRDMVQNHQEKHFDEIFSIKTSEINKYTELIDEIKTDQWRAELQDMYNDAKSVNLDLMLETEFLRRQLEVAGAVKSKLDYQVAVEKVDKELAQDHMVKWIEDKVMAAITPASQRKALDACIAQLNTISK